MADKIKLKVDHRKLTGRKVKNLRKEGILPANIYGKGIKSVSVQLATKEFEAVFKQAGETNIINLTVGQETKTRPVLIHNIHLDPATDSYLHADFYQVDLTKKVTVSVPVELTGKAPGEEAGGVLVQVLNEVEVEALPTDLPDKFELDISVLEEIGQSLTLKDLKLDKKVSLTSDNLDEVIVQIETPSKEEEKPAEEAVEGEEGEEAVEGEEGEEAKEGEEPKEGKQAKPDEAKKEAEAKPKEEKK